MLRHNFLISYRTLLKDKGYTLINIGGLAVGMAVAMLIGMWVQDELSFNRNFKNYETIAEVKLNRLWRGEISTNNTHVAGLGHVLKTTYGNNFDHVITVRRAEENIIASEKNKFTELGNFMGKEASEMLSFKMKYGTHEGLEDMKSIFLSEKLSRKLFGKKDPLGEIITFNTFAQIKVTGVFENFPNNSEFGNSEYVIPIELYYAIYGGSAETWENQNMQHYVQIREDKTFTEVSKNIENATLPYTSEKWKAANPKVFLQPMSEWHLYSEFENGEVVTSNELKMVWLYGIIGAFVLFLACINFMNLSTARSEKRVKEIGIRKSVGSLRHQLIYQFLAESLLVALVAFLGALIIVVLALPAFNEIAGKELFILWTSPLFWIGNLSFIIITGLLAGSYPAFYLSSFAPVDVLKGTFRLGRFAALPRKGLVIFQFTISIALIIGSTIVNQQIQYAKERPVGYERDALIMMPMMSRDFVKNYDVIRNELLQTGVVDEVAASNYSIATTRGNNDGFTWKDKDPNPTNDPSFNTIRISHEYGKAVGLEFIEGRDFSRDLASDAQGVIINESALEVMGLENPIGENIQFNENYFGGNNFTILGVTKDILKGSPYEKANPSLMFLTEDKFSIAFIKMSAAASAHDALPKIQSIINRIVPSIPFEYEFVDEIFAQKFEAEERISRLSNIFSLLAIFISCLGLFGLASYVAERKTKEIGIRKVLGASVVNLWQMLSSEFIKLVLISCFVAIPIAYYFLNEWLKDYDYRIEISAWTFLWAGVGAMMITIFTVSFQTIKAAMMNPANNLKE
ncbi:MAG: ABC transporter permease [Saprospiraceae bacterium]